MEDRWFGQVKCPIAAMDGYPGKSKASKSLNIEMEPGTAHATIFKNTVGT